jgi:hypothetical protein
MEILVTLRQIFALTYYTWYADVDAVSRWVVNFLSKHEGLLYARFVDRFEKSEECIPNLGIGNVKMGPSLHGAQLIRKFQILGR